MKLILGPEELDIGAQAQFSRIGREGGERDEGEMTERLWSRNGF